MVVASEADLDAITRAAQTTSIAEKYDVELSLRRFGQEGKVFDALSTFTACRRSGMVPSVSAYREVASLAVKNGFHEYAVAVLRDMFAQGLRLAGNVQSARDLV